MAHEARERFTILAVLATSGTEGLKTLQTSGPVDSPLHNAPMPLGCMGLFAGMRPHLTIAIDFDDTFTADVEMWSHVISEFQRFGHRVVCVSARRNEIGHRQELTRSLPDGVTVLLSNDAPKRLYAKSQGVDVDIWIDDMPEAIPTKQDMLAVRG